ncbi:hypothetical protein [Pelagicoccus mobilis]|uniref:Uncharacterized protein n=1 Tax=Pelagicoccus mobilis TaxID=415221 RepID=A0A934S1B8_9BACT|nr:hypothetical protein [Pelagicoccus mobilis]MBK1880108.1 hypothetical protein [Pelagicoccus mobilis]
MIRKTIAIIAVLGFASASFAGQYSSQNSKGPKQGETSMTSKMIKDNGTSGQYSSLSKGPKQSDMKSNKSLTKQPMRRALSGQYSSIR